MVSFPGTLPFWISAGQNAILSIPEFISYPNLTTALQLKASWPKVNSSAQFLFEIFREGARHTFHISNARTVF